jgi:magnesium transporter
MDDSQHTPPEGAEEKVGLSVEPEGHLVEQIRDLLAREHLEAALLLFNTLHPADQGDVLVDLPRGSQQELLTAVRPEESADILELLRPAEAVQVSEPMAPEALADILDEASPDVAADVLRNIPSRQSEETLEAMEEASEVIPLLGYADDTAGGLMRPDYMAVKQDIYTANALDTLRFLETEGEHTSQVLVVDNDNRLVGALSLIRLALSRSSAIVQDIMEREIRSVTAETDQEDCARLIRPVPLSRPGDAADQLVAVGGSHTLTLQNSKRRWNM